MNAQERVGRVALRTVPQNRSFVSPSAPKYTNSLFVVNSAKTKIAPYFPLLVVCFAHSFSLQRRLVRIDDALPAAASHAELAENIFFQLMKRVYVNF